MVGTNYKQTDIGQIPEDWEIVKIGESFSFKNGLNKEKQYFGYGFPIVNYMDVFKNTFINKQTIKGKVFVNKQELRNFNVNKGDVLFTRTSETQEEIGYSAVIIEELEDTVFSGFVLRGRPFNNLFSIQYCRYVFSNKIVREQIISNASFTTRALTNGRVLSEVKIPLPPLPEQKAIAEVLSDTDHWITSLEDLIAKKQLIKQGAMQKLLTPKEDWEVKKLEDLLENIIDNRGKTPPIDKNGFYLLEVNSLGNRHPNLSKVTKYINQYNYDNFLRNYLKIGDLLFSTVGNIGKTSIYNDLNSCIAQNIVGFRFSKCNSYFMKYYFDTNIMQSIFESILMSGVQPSIKVTQLIRLELLIPSLSEQENIASILSDMDAEIETLDQKLTKAKQIKQGLMQKLLTGRIRLV